MEPEIRLFHTTSGRYQVQQGEKSADDANIQKSNRDIDVLLKQKKKLNYLKWKEVKDADLE